MKQEIIYHHKWWLPKRIASIVFAFGIAPYLLIRYSYPVGEFIDAHQFWIGLSVLWLIAVISLVWLWRFITMK